MSTATRRTRVAGPHTARLWSIQPVEVWTALQAEGVLYVDEALIPEFDPERDAYEWMREQMGQRLPGYAGHYPWWAYDYQLDLRTYRFLAGRPGSRNVRLELAVPRQQVLFSAYGAWHCVLGQWYLPYPVEAEEYDREFEAWEAELERLGIARRGEPLPEPYQSRLVRSWERIFDVEELRASNTIQATFERLALADVVAVTEFTTQPGQRENPRMRTGRREVTHA